MRLFRRLSLPNCAVCDMASNDILVAATAFLLAAARDNQLGARNATRASPLSENRCGLLARDAILAPPEVAAHPCR